MGLLGKWFGTDKAEREAYYAQEAWEAEQVVASTEAQEKMWGWYVEQMAEVGSQYVTDMSTEQARMAAGGMRSGTGAWERTLQGVDLSYRTAVEDIRAGETYAALTEYYTAQDGVGGIEFWFGGQYGEMNPYPTEFQERADLNNNLAISDYIPEGTGIQEKMDEWRGMLGIEPGAPPLEEGDWSWFKGI